MLGDEWDEQGADVLREAVGRFVRSARSRDEMPSAQATVLGRLDRAGGLSISELAADERVRHQSMQQTVQLLVRAGVVTTAADRNDRRKVVCTITEAGRDRLARDRTARTRRILDAAARLTSEQRRSASRIAELLDLLTDGLA